MKREKSLLHYFLSKVRQLYLMKDASANPESKIQHLAEKTNFQVSSVLPIRIAQLSFVSFLLIALLSAKMMKFFIV